MQKSFFVFVGILIIGLIYSVVFAMSDNLLEKYEANYERFEEIEIGDKIVYYYQRAVEDAIVEKDYIVYQFDKETKELIAKKSHWRDDLPEKLPEIKVTKEQAESMVKGEALFSNLYIISPQSDVFPIKPTPKNPCWAVRSSEQGRLIVTVVDAVEGRILGYGIPPPYTAFSLSGPEEFYPCRYSWNAWYQNAASWFNTMGYTTEAVSWPTEAKVQSHIQSRQTAMFYELAHGGSYSFASGCLEGGSAEITYASEIKNWIANYPKMPFTFIGSCAGMGDTALGSFSYEFRKGSSENTVTVGYCGMSESQCAICWVQSLEWQHTLFNYMNQGYPVKYAFDQANADWPYCAEGTCMRFAGDTNFSVVPPVCRVGCGETITQDITLTGDLRGCSGNGITVGASGITLDCDGHIIEGLGSNSGILLTARHNVTIKNCEVRGFDYGIRLNMSSNDTVINNTANSNSSAGIYLNASSYSNTLTDNIANNNKYGILLERKSTNNYISSNDFIENTEYGAYLSDSSKYNTFWGNSFTGNGLNACEDSGSKENSWNLADTGNYWSDCIYNPGHPDHYQIQGEGDGVDYYPECPSNYPPELFSLVSPEDSNFVPVEVTFEWEDAVDPDTLDTVGYDLYISRSIVFDNDSTETYSNLFDTTFTAFSLDIGTHYWKVQACDQWGGEKWSNETWSFYVYICGDVDFDASINLSDVVYLAQHVFGIGRPPAVDVACDVNCDSYINLSDVRIIAKYYFGIPGFELNCCGCPEP